MILAVYTRWTQYTQYLDCQATKQSTSGLPRAFFVNLLHSWLDTRSGLAGHWSPKKESRKTLVLLPCCTIG